jgi:predicted transglutaminase-like cysteine proteinase
MVAFGVLRCAAGPLPPSWGENSAPAGPDTTAPVGWIDFCARYQGECDDRDLPQTPVALTAQAWADLRSINDAVNRTIVAESDLAHWNVGEKWDYPWDGRGDCEDYVLLKRKLLIEDGYPRQALLITVVFRPADSEGHAVLMVRTDSGDLILDNRRSNILDWNNTGYGFIKRQSEENQDRWVLLASPTSEPAAVSAQSGDR